MTPPVQGPGEGLNAAVAAELRAEIARQRRSTQWIADRSGVAYGSLRRYLGATRHIDMSVLAAICHALGVSPRDVMMAAESRKPSPLAETLAEGILPHIGDKPADTAEGA